MRISIVLAALRLSGSSLARAETGKASNCHGAGKSGEMTCAHRSRPFGSMVRVSYGNRSIQCRINDRGPLVRGRIIEVSIAAAKALVMMDAGVVEVSIE
jgi:rare lipoprotein A